MINTSACYLHRQASLEAIYRAIHFFQQLSYNTKAHNHLQSPSLLGHWQTRTVCLTISTSLLFPFKGPLLICYHSHCSSALCCLPYTLKILHFKFLFSLSNLFHSFSHLIKFHYFTATLLTYKNPCILPYKNEKSLQFSSPIGFRLILHSHFGTSDYLMSVNVSEVIFQPYG